MLMLIAVLVALCSMVSGLLSVAFLTLLERKLMASMQLRLGPNMVGLWGILQPIADGLKLLVKEMLVPASAQLALYMVAPIMLLVFSLALWALVPMGSGLVCSDMVSSLLLLLACSSLNVHAIAMAGWASQSSYALLGAVRSAAQMIAYELVLGTVVLAIMMLASSASMVEIIEAQGWLWYGVCSMPMVLVYYVAMLAETNRAPFDLPEAEAELVAGYNVEYGSGAFAFFFIGEYSNILVLSALGATLFAGGYSVLPVSWAGGLAFMQYWWLGPIAMAAKIVLLSSTMIVVRAAYPRYRYDQLMVLGWKTLLPVVFALLLQAMAYMVVL
nr:NADH dehydrogenase subunit 1 [Bangiopsis subsimplex]